MTKYWVVGAMWGGQHDMLESFWLGGYWYLGWSSDQDPDQSALRDQMAVGDRIAVKKMLGRGSSDVEIRMIGIIKHVDMEDEHRRIYVNWVARDLSRNVPARGCFESVYGPLEGSDPWVEKAFCL